LAISYDPSALADAESCGLLARWRSLPRRKAASLALALGLEALIVLILLTLGAQIVGEEDGKEVVTEFKAIEFAAPPEPEPQPATDAPPETSEVTPQDQPLPTPDPPRPSPLLLNPAPAPEPPPAPLPPQPKPEPKPEPPPKVAAKINPGRTYGPVDTGNPRTAGDSQRVGTAPDGEPLYAARWYREPTDSELAGYLSTANGPGSALIACKTVPDYYVEDCVLLGESPQGSQIGRAVMAAAWQFRVRPARIGGREQVGSWVRIRIDYTVRRGGAP
jgi:protein TonB